MTKVGPADLIRALEMLRMMENGGLENRLEGYKVIAEVLGYEYRLPLQVSSEGAGPTAHTGARSETFRRRVGQKATATFKHMLKRVQDFEFLSSVRALKSFRLGPMSLCLPIARMKVVKSVRR